MREERGISEERGITRGLSYGVRQGVVEPVVIMIEWEYHMGE